MQESTLVVLALLHLKELLLEVRAAAEGYDFVVSDHVLKPFRKNAL